MNEPIVGQASLAGDVVDDGAQHEDSNSSNCLKEVNKDEGCGPGTHSEATTNASDGNDTNQDTNPPKMTFKVLKEVSDYLEYLLYFKITEPLVVDDRTWAEYSHNCFERAWDPHLTAKDRSWAEGESKRGEPSGSSWNTNLFDVPRFYEEAQRTPCANIDRLALRLLRRIMVLMHYILSSNHIWSLANFYKHLSNVHLSDTQVEYLDATLNAGGDIVESEWEHTVPF